MTATTLGEKSPDMFKTIGGAILSFLLSVKFALLCLIAFMVCDISTSVNAGYTNFWWGGLVALGAFISSIVTATVLDSRRYFREHGNLRCWDPSDFFFSCDGARWVWLIFGPTFMSFLAMSFVFYPMKDAVVLVNGEVLTKTKLLNPWQNNVVAIDGKHSVSLNAWAYTKDGRRVRGAISASCVLGEDRRTWTSNAKVKENAYAEIRRCFEETIGKMDVRDLEHSIVIESTVATNARLSDVGLKLEPGSIVEAYGIHAAVPGS